MNEWILARPTGNTEKTAAVKDSSFYISQV